MIPYATRDCIHISACTDSIRPSFTLPCEVCFTSSSSFPRKRESGGNWSAMALRSASRITLLEVMQRKVKQMASNTQRHLSQDSMLLYLCLPATTSLAARENKRASGRAAGWIAAWLTHGTHKHFEAVLRAGRSAEFARRIELQQSQLSKVSPPMLSVLLFSLKPKLFSNEVGVQQWLQTGHHQAWQIQLEQLRAVHSPAPDACLSFVSLSFFLSVCLSVFLSVCLSGSNGSSGTTVSILTPPCTQFMKTFLYLW